MALANTLSSYVCSAAQEFANCETPSEIVNAAANCSHLMTIAVEKYINGLKEFAHISADCEAKAAAEINYACELSENYSNDLEVLKNQHGERLLARFIHEF